MPRGVRTALLALLLLAVSSPPVTAAGPGPGGGSAGYSLAFRALPAREKKAMQREILGVFGLSRRPRPRDHTVGRRSAPRYLLDLYNSTGDDLDEGGGADIVISFLNRAHERKIRELRHEAARTFWFDVSEVQPSDRVLHAELRIYRNKSRVSHDTTFIATLYELKDEGNEVTSLYPAASLKLTDKDYGWLIFNITETFLTWVAFPQKNLGMVMAVQKHHNGPEVSLKEAALVGAKGPEEYQPFMAAFFSSQSQGRRRTTRSTRKRHSPESTMNDHYSINPFSNYEYYPSSKRTCQRWNLYVSFRDLGWQDWIIAPEGYGAYYCHGECSFPLHAQMNATNHAIVQTLVHLLEPGVVPKPCCAPTQLLPITVLYFDDNSNVILKKYKNMVVKSCGCH